MTNLKLFFIFFTLLTLFSCEKDCKLKPIPDNIFVLNKMEDVLFFKNSKEIDSAIIIRKIDFYRKSSYKGLMNYRECEHLKLYEIDFKGDIITISVRKNSSDILDLEVMAFGTCHDFLIEKTILEKELTLEKNYIFESKLDIDSIDCNIGIKKIILKGSKIESITRIDGKVWENIK